MLAAILTTSSLKSGWRFLAFSNSFLGKVDGRSMNGAMFTVSKLKLDFERMEIPGHKI